MTAMEEKVEQIEDIKDIPCPKCGKCACDWVDASFFGWLQADYCVFDSRWRCDECGHEWEMQLDFKFTAAMRYDEDGSRTEYDVKE